MKKNGILFVILVGLITFVYYYHELGDKKREQTQKKRSQVFTYKLNFFDTIILGDYKLVKKDSKWYLDQLMLPVSEEYLENIEKLLQDVHIVDRFNFKKISETKRDFFFHEEAQSLSFIKDQLHLKFSLGKLIPTTGRFYLERIRSQHKELFVCKSVNEKEGFFKSELDYEASKYADLKTLFSSNITRILSSNFLEIISAPEIIEAIWYREGSPIFSLLVEENKTSPPVFQGLEYSKEKIWAFKKSIQSTKVLSIIEEEMKLGAPVRIIDIKHRSGPVRLSLYKKAAKFYLRPDNGPIYRVYPSTIKYFFHSVQHFWDRSIQFSEQKESVLGEELTFYLQNGPLVKIVFEDSEGLAMNTLLEKVDFSEKREQVLEMLTVFMGQEDGLEADYVELFSKVKQFSKDFDFQFSVSFFETRLDLYRWQSYLLVVDEKRNMAYHYELSRLGDWWKELANSLQVRKRVK